MPQSVAKTRTKMMPCRVCGVDMMVGRNKVKSPCHAECAINVVVQNAMDLHNHSGPGYDRWLQGCLNSAKNRGTGSGVPSK